MTNGLGRSTASGGALDIRALDTPSRLEIERLAAIFDRYRTHYGETANAATTGSWLEATIGSGRLHAFVAVDSSSFIGFAMTMVVPASLRLGHFWQIRDLFVLPDHRRLGVAGALLDVIRTTALGTGASRLVLQTEVENTSALRLYANKGYSIVEGYCSLTLTLGSDGQES